ncbi:DUF3152 domain-containing protein [Streptomyces sp. NPDC004065]|uniref:DUF3152 domain-containing protein n=1 Tax=Streptomyces sp. NPDC004065 TaxID=3364689 RepID=UPI00384FF383
MGRHSRRGPAPKSTGATTAGRDGREGREGRGASGGRDDRSGPEGPGDPGFPTNQHGRFGQDGGRDTRGAAEGLTGPGGWSGGPQGRPGTVQGPPAGPWPGTGPLPGRHQGGGPAYGGFPDGTPAHGVPRFPDGTPAHGVPRLPDGTPARGVPQARGGHPEQWEAGGGWGQLGPQGGAGIRGARGRAAAAGPGAGVFPGTAAGPGAGVVPGAAAGRAAPAGPVTSPRPGAPFPRQRRAPAEAPVPASPGAPRQDYLDAFDSDQDLFVPRPRGAASAVTGAAAPAEHGAVPAGGSGADGDTAPPADEPASARGTKGRTFTGIAAAAVTTVLAVVVAGQVTDGNGDPGARAQSAPDRAGDARSALGGQADPAAPPKATVLTYDQKMSAKYPLGADLKGSGRFETVPGSAKAPGKGRTYTYRVDVEQGLGLDGLLFAEAVQKTLNDDRSWAHAGARTFERVSSGKADFVITLASPGTTATWCAKSGLDTTEDNVSCDSAATERVMINAYRWAQGSKTFGDRMFAYRQMLINHEVGHRLGFGHVTCDKDGGLAPVMQQQTKFLDHDGIHCLPNPWPHPTS